MLIRGGYIFPEPFPLDKCLADLLEQEVEEKYYLDDARIKTLMETSDTDKLAGEGFEIVTDYGQD